MNAAIVVDHEPTANPGRHVVRAGLPRPIFGDRGIVGLLWPCGHSSDGGEDVCPRCGAASATKTRRSAERP